MISPGSLLDRIGRWFAWHLPRRVVFHTIMRAWAYASCGDREGADAPKIDEVAKLWE